MTQEHTILTIAVLGGTGKEGAGLAMRWALNGYKVIIGSRNAERAQQRVAELNARLGGDYLTGMENSKAAQASNLVVLSVPYSAHKTTLESVKEHLAGKILVDLTVALQPPRVRTVHLPEGQASALEAQAIVGDNVKVISGFHHISSDHLADTNFVMDSDVLICGNDAEAKANVIKLAEALGCRGVDAGPLVNAIAVEAMTPVLLYINKAYGIKGAGIHITGI